MKQKYLKQSLEHYSEASSQAREFLEVIHESEKDNLITEYRSCCLNSSLMYIKLEKYREAIDSAKIAQSFLTPESNVWDKVCYRIGLAHNKLKEYEEAKESFDKCNSDNSDPNLQQEKQITTMELQKIADAVKKYNEDKEKVDLK